MPDTTCYLFVYGTLLNEKNEFGRYLKNNCVFYQSGRFNGLLYDIGDYPGAIHQLNAEGFVYGSIFIVNNEPVETLKILDDYEGFGEDQPQPNEFIRALIEVETADRPIWCWVYLYNLPVNELKYIASGKYL